MGAIKRILIPKNLREVASLKPLTEVALCMKNYSLFFLVNIDEVSSENIIVKFVKLDDKGRISFPPRYLRTANLSEETVFLKGNMVYISFNHSICI